MKPFICIHGHFYQPPRENPWTGRIDSQPSAAPFHDWNQRITEECYRSNAHVPIHDSRGRLLKKVSNYEWMSFNFGPTLLSWLESNERDVYQTILDADRQSCLNFNGHGSAVAQVYNHAILPLCNPADKITQVKWGVEDFRFRFQRNPEGLWLSETGVDTPTLETLARHGIRFTVLSPYQARQYRMRKDRDWVDVRDGGIPTAQPYLCRLPDGETIYIFFYHGELARQIAFGPLLESGEGFAHHLLKSMASGMSVPGLVHVATDGETFGHHKRFGNLALAYMFEYIRKNELATITNYADFLDQYDPAECPEVKIHEHSAWSCHDGLIRWGGQTLGGSFLKEDPDYAWRIELRNAFNKLRDDIDEIFQERSGCFSEDPWVVRNEFIHWILDASGEKSSEFSRRYFQTEENVCLQLLEMQTNRLFMFTSCAWFFEDVTRLEVRQNLQYAARAIELARTVTGRDLEQGFMKDLESAKSHHPRKTARTLYEEYVLPLR